MFRLYPSNDSGMSRSPVSVTSIFIRKIRPFFVLEIIVSGKAI